jgi:hypothetical protein
VGSVARRGRQRPSCYWLSDMPPHDKRNIMLIGVILALRGIDFSLGKELVLYELRQDILVSMQ